MKRSNGSVQLRKGNGQFKKATLADFGIKTCTRARVCNGCGNIWHPIVPTGICLKCDSQNSAPQPLTEEEKTKLAEYRSFGGPFPDPRTVHQEQRLYDWLNSCGVFEVNA